MGNKLILISEEDEVKFQNYDQLSYLNNGDRKEDGSPVVALYVDNNFIGDIEVWCDGENDERDYVCINYEMVYLDTIREDEW